MQSLEQCNGQDHPEDSIESAGIRDGIEVGAEQKSGRTRFYSCIKPTKISGCVDCYFDSERCHPGGNFRVAIVHGRGKKSPLCAARVFAEACQPAATRDHFFRTISDLTGSYLHLDSIRGPMLRV